MLSTFLNFLILNFSIGSILTGWIQILEPFDYIQQCTINPNSRIRFFSMYCEKTFIDIMEIVGIQTVPLFIEISVVIVACFSFFLLLLKLSFSKYKKLIVLFEINVIMFSLLSIFLYLDVIKSQITFTDANSHYLHTGFKLQLFVIACCTITTILSIIKLNITNDSYLLWIN